MRILDAIRYWEDHTCIRFEHVQDRLSELDDHIEFFKGEGCYSMVGRFGGRQGVSIGPECERTGIVEHEIGHVLGLWHEQSRPDAYDYIKLIKQNIISTYMSDFKIRDKNEVISLGVPYDYGSIMHYGPTAFSFDGKSLTIVTKNKLYRSTIGQREKLSFFDIQIINKAYCLDKCLKNDNLQQSKYLQVNCQNGGYLHPLNCNKCLCPSGYGGDDCSEFESPQNAECGGILNLDFVNLYEIKSPGYDEEGYEENQLCNWILKAPKNARIKVEFMSEFAFLCSSICQDYVELKLAQDQRATGSRFCCDKKPKNELISESNLMAVIFRSQASQDRGFFIQVQATKKPATKTQKDFESNEKTISKIKTLPGRNIWSAWGEWSACSKSCGACGIQSRIRACLSSECEDRNQEFSACNFEACPVKEECNKILYLNKICKRDTTGSAVCSNISKRLNECDKTSCCPPFIAVNGQCVTSYFDQSQLK